MVAWRDVKPGDAESATGDRAYLVTHAEDVGEFSRKLHYLLPNGRRPTVVIDAARDSDELRHSLGMAFSKGKRRYNPQRSRRQPE